MLAMFAALVTGAEDVSTGGAAPAPAQRRRLVLADESRPRLHYWDSADPSACFSIPGERPMWDLKRVGDMKYRAVCKKGFMVFDLRARKVVDEFRHPLLDEVTAVCDMPDGGFVASVNPRTGPDKNKVVLLVRFSADRKPVATYRCEGFFYARSLEWDRDGETLLLSWEKGFARLRLPDASNVCRVLDDFRQPKGETSSTWCRSVRATAIWPAVDTAAGSCTSGRTGKPCPRGSSRKRTDAAASSTRSRKSVLTDTCTWRTGRGTGRTTPRAAGRWSSSTPKAASCGTCTPRNGSAPSPE